MNLLEIKKDRILNTRFNKIHRNLKQRCSNKNRLDYKWYGEKGIIVCKEWMKFKNFEKDMYQSYLNHVKQFGEKDTSIDRISNEGNYCKENCKWSTQLEQINNRTNMVLFEAISPSGVMYHSKNQRRFAEDNGLNYKCLNNCLRGKNKTHKGWSFKYMEEDNG